jgi:uncharacterized protein (UPF0147 family)
MNQEQTLNELLEILEELSEDQDLHPKIIADAKLLIHVLNEPIDMNLRVDRCRNIVEDLDKKPDLDMTIRMQLWNVTSLLEQL